MVLQSGIGCMRWVPVFCSLIVVTSASAGDFQCQHLTQGDDSTLVCSDNSNDGSGSVGWVSLRKMPGWNAQAGLTLIDFCLVPKIQEPPDFEKGVQKEPSQGPDEIQIDKLQLETPTKNCQRRYCTDQKNQFSLLINGIPIPIGWSFVSFWIGYQHQSFSIHCESVL